MIREAIAMYRARDAAFGPMPEPQWRILLDLAADGDCDISSACVASGAAMTTALRHIQRLEAAGLVTRYPDQFDRRRWWLSLTDEALNRFATLSPPRSQAGRADDCAGKGSLLPPVLPGAFFSPVHAAVDAAARQEDHHG